MNRYSAAPDSNLRQTTTETGEPVAIVGIGCKLPGGVTDHRSYWKLICSRKSGIREIPADRWAKGGFYDKNKDAIASSVSKWAGFVDHIRSFDAESFGISPREAAAMDPQQRMLLEAVSDAVQDASMPISEFSNSDTGVFVGVSQSDYKIIQEMRISNTEIFAGTGAALCINANRISHRFGLKGPSYAVDTACSSSLVALDQACQNIASGSCEMAVACGVNVIAHPAPFLVFSKAGMLSDTGVLSSFDKNANGYVRGEGVGAVLLKKLDRALADGDDIYAVIKGTSVNQDGYTNTLTAPNQNAQIAMLEDLCEKSGVLPDDIGFVEAHGTGTPIGDPIEAGAIGVAIGKKKSNGPIYVGSVKSNIGHLESAAGISGLIKAALSIKYGKIPPNINFSRANPNIPMDILNIEVPTSVKPFPSSGSGRYAIVNSFGFGGTNASVLLTSPPPVNPLTPPRSTKIEDHEPLRVSISSTSKKSLRQIAVELVKAIRKNPILKEAGIAELAAAISHAYKGRNYRACIIAFSKAELLRGLRQIADDNIKQPAQNKGPYVFIGEEKAGRKVAFVYTGQGSQWYAMARQLILTNQVFGDALAKFDEHFSKSSGWSIREELLKSENESNIDDTSITQPALFAIQIGLSAIWKSFGLEPDMVVGHSIGEAAAMYTAGGITLESAARFLDKRGSIRDQLSASGSMAAIGMNVDQVEVVLENEKLLEIAAVNAPNSTTITGDKEAIENFIDQFQLDYPGVFIKQLRVDTAWHSFQLDDGKQWFEENMEELNWRPPEIPFISTVSGRLETCFNKAYGWENLRRPVLFKKGIEVASKMGVNIFVEIGPHSTLKGPVSSICSGLNTSVDVINSLDRNLDDRLALAKAMAQISVLGFDYKSQGIDPIPAILHEIPAIPKDREQFWKDSEESRQLQSMAHRHPLLGIPILGSTKQWKCEINLDALKYLEDHKLQDDCLFPAAGYIEMVVAVGREIYGDGPLEVADMAIHEALFINRGDEIIFQSTFDQERGICRVYTHLRDGDIDDWTLRAQGIVRRCVANPPKIYSFKRSRKGQKKIALKKVYATNDPGTTVNYGPAFQCIRDLWMTKSRSSARIVKSDQISDDFEKYLAHPAMVDACLQVTDPRMTLEKINTPMKAGDPIHLPVGAKLLRFYRSVPAEVMVHAEQFIGDLEDVAQGGFLVTDMKGNPVMQITGLMNQRLPSKKIYQGEGEDGPSIVIENYVDLPDLDEDTAGEENAGHWLLFCNDDTYSAQLSDLFARQNKTMCVLSSKQITGHPPDWIEDQISTNLKDGNLAGIIFAWGIGGRTTAKNPTTENLVSKIERKICDLVWFGQALNEFRFVEPMPKIFVLTDNARAIGEEILTTSGLINTPLVALVRTLSAEYQEFSISQIDIGDKIAEIKIHLKKIFFGNTKETELIVRENGIIVPRLQRIDKRELPARRKMVGKMNGSSNFQVSMVSPGILENLDLHEIDVPQPNHGEVKLSVRAVGLNFRDIMAATGLLPREAEPVPAWTTLGLEFGAVVAEVGKGVTDLKPGDHVMGMAKSCLQRYLCLPASALSKVPKNISLVDVSTIPSAFATAYYALDRIGRLRKGEKILIHVATGGVGLAAVQLAQMIGAEIFATAGSPKKRRYLRQLGIKHVMNSRNYKFADAVMKITGGEGVDVILNSLPDTYIQKGLDILAPYGRFLEIGKRDVYLDYPVGLKALRNNVSFCVLDLAALGYERPDLMGEMFKDLVKLFKSKKIKPLPHTIFPVDKVADAFKFMSQAKHIGKVVVSFELDEYSILENREKEFKLDTKASYLVTGGSRGFGLTVANWLSRKGAGKILLTSRSGKVDAEYLPIVEKMRRRGTVVSSLAVDVTSSADVDALFEKHAAGPKPIKGIIHAAAVIQDALLTQLDEDLIKRVIRPKVAGAWNIYQAVRKTGSKPDFIVNFSSVAQLLGSGGQGNYVAANAFLDGLSQYLSNKAINCRTVDWGVLGESGFVTRDKTLKKYLDSVGMNGLTDKEACEALEAIIRSSQPSFLFAAMDWQKLTRANPILGNSPRLLFLLQKRSKTSSQFRADLLNLDAERRAARMADFLCSELGNVLKVKPKQISIDRPMMELGLDSLSAFELKHRIEGELDMSISTSKFLQSPSIAELSQLVSLEIENLAAVEKAKAAQLKNDAKGTNNNKTDISDVFVSDRQAGLLRASTGDLTSDIGFKAYTNQLAVSLDRMIELEALDKSLKKLVRRHPQLAMRYNPDAVENSELMAPGGEPLRIQKCDEISRQRTPVLQIEKGELFAIHLCEDSTRTLLCFNGHKGLLDTFSLYNIVDDFLKLLSGESLKRKNSSKKMGNLMQSRVFDMENPVNSGDRTFWFYAANPLAAAVKMPKRKRALTNIIMGCAPGASVSTSLSTGHLEGKDNPPRQAFSLIVQSFILSLQNHIGRQTALTVTVQQSNRLPGAVPHAAVGVFDSEHPVTFDTSPAGVSQLKRTLSSMGNHAGFDQYSFLNEFGDEVDRAHASPGQFSILLRQDGEMHPLERNLSEGSVQYGNISLAQLHLSQPPVLADICLDVACIDDRLHARVKYDAMVCSPRQVKNISRLIEHSIDELSGELSLV